MNFNKSRLIPTGLYGAHAKEILDSVSGQMSDGKWENTPGYDKYWTNFNVIQADDGEIVFEINLAWSICWGSKWLDNPFRTMSDAEFKAWYAKKLKAVIMQEFRDNHSVRQWNRKNLEYKSNYLGHCSEEYGCVVTVADIYCVYDQLLGREIGVTKYDISTITRVFGQKRTADEISKIKSLNEAKEAIQAKYSKLRDESKAKMEAEIANIKKLFNEEHDKLLYSERDELAALETAKSA